MSWNVCQRVTANCTRKGKIVACHCYFYDSINQAVAANGYEFIKQIYKAVWFDGYWQGRLGLCDTIYSVYVFRGFVINFIGASQMAFMAVQSFQSKAIMSDCGCARNYVKSHRAINDNQSRRWRPLAAAVSAVRSSRDQSRVKQVAVQWKA